jgi:predicted  nucleic acid-binding Zn-ribbon protein
VLLGIENPSVQNNNETAKLKAEIECLKKENAELEKDIRKIEQERKNWTRKIESFLEGL